MAITLIDWKDGEGQIVASFGGRGDGPLRLSSNTANEDVDRSQDVTVAADGGTPAVTVAVSQYGLRERFLTAQSGEPVFLTADNEIFAVLKV